VNITSGEKIPVERELQIIEPPGRKAEWAVRVQISPPPRKRRIGSDTSLALCHEIQGIKFVLVNNLIVYTF
jgi:hypothetical protein